MQNNKTYTNTM